MERERATPPLPSSVILYILSTTFTSISLLLQYTSLSSIPIGILENLFSLCYLQKQRRANGDGHPAVLRTLSGQQVCHSMNTQFQRAHVLSLLPLQPVWSLKWKLTCFLQHRRSLDRHNRRPDQRRSNRAPVSNENSQQFRSRHSRDVGGESQIQAYIQGDFCPIRKLR